MASRVESVSSDESNCDNKPIHGSPGGDGAATTGLLPPLPGPSLPSREREEALHQSGHSAGQLVPVLALILVPWELSSSQAACIIVSHVQDYYNSLVSAAMKRNDAEMQVGTERGH